MARIKATAGICGGWTHVAEGWWKLSRKYLSLVKRNSKKDTWLSKYSTSKNAHESRKRLDWPGVIIGLMSEVFPRSSHRKGSSRGQMK